MESDRSTRVLVVDDEDALLETYAAMLSIDYEVETAASGTDALAKISTEIDVVLLDRRMPDRSGEAILSEIRSRGVDCQVVFCSAVVPDVDIVPLEIDAYLQKPVSPDDLSETIAHQSELGSRSDAAREYAALEAKRAAIETAGAPPETDEQYQALLVELEEKRQRVDTTELETASA